VTSLIKLDQLVFPKASLQAAKVLAYLASESPEPEQIDNAIMQDPVLAGTLIRYANSPMYRRGDEVTNVPTATRMIGLKNVRSAVVVSTLRSVCPVDSALSQTILSHSLAIAAMSKLIARKTCPASADDLELMGLIHDIGMVVLASNIETDYKTLIAKSQTESIALDELERTRYGFSHDQIAAKALHEFRLPQRHEIVLTHFHQENSGELDAEMAKERAVLVLAHRLLAEVEEVTAFNETLFETTEALCEQIDINEEKLTTMRAQAIGLVSGQKN